MRKQADNVTSHDETSKDEKQHYVVDNLLQNNRSVYRTAFAFVVPKTEPIHLVLVGLMAGRQTKALLFKKI